MVKSFCQVKYADTTLRESWIFEGGSKEKKIPIVFAFYFVETENKKILLDAGCDSMPPHWVMENFVSPAEALRKLGIAPREITDVILTHRHWDHAQGVHPFPQTTVYIQTREYDETRKLIPEGTAVTLFEESCCAMICKKRAERLSFYPYFSANSTRGVTSSRPWG